VEERYGTHARYVAAVEKAAAALAKDRLLLPMDAKAFVGDAKGEAVGKRFTTP
jgi:hypothetical protein